jgi:hypothetical protein
MSRRSQNPTYRLHQQSGHAIVTLPDGMVGRRDVLLGKYHSEESWAEYHRVLAEWGANSRRPVDRTSATKLSVNELILAYPQFVEGYNRRPNGTPTNEVHNVKLALRPPRKLYGHTLAASFDTLALEVLRAQMIRDSPCRNRVNKDVPASGACSAGGRRSWFPQVSTTTWQPWKGSAPAGLPGRRRHGGGDAPPPAPPGGRDGSPPAPDREAARRSPHPARHRP